MSFSNYWLAPESPVYAFDTERRYGILGNTKTGGGVIPAAYDEDATWPDLQVSTTSGDVIIAPGRAYVNGFLYENTEDVAITPDSATNNRYDAVVLNYDFSLKTVRAQLQKGTEAATPVYPTVSSEDLLLAYVFIPAGFTSGVTGINSYDIQDRRKFVTNGWERSRWFGDRKNLIPNPEFMAFSGGTNLPPDGWYKSGSPNITRNTAAKSTPRGFTIQLDGTVASDAVGTFFIANGGSWGQYRSKRPIAVLVRIKLDSGKRAKVKLGQGDIGAMSIMAQQLHRYQSSDEIDVLFYDLVPNVGNALRIEVEDDNPATAGNIYITYVSATFGYTPLRYSIYSEKLLFDYAVTDSNWDGTTGYSSGTTQIDLTTDWSGIIPPEIRFMIARFAIRDSGSAAAAEGACECEIRYPGATDYLIKLSAAGRANDDWVEQLVYIPIDNDNAGNPAFDVVATATGATTMDIILLPIGIIT